MAVIRGVFRTSKRELSAKTVNGFHALTNFAKSTILDNRQGSEYDFYNDDSENNNENWRSVLV